MPTPAKGVVCPHCHTTYTLEWLGIPARVGTVATVVCVCGHDLTVTIHAEPRKILGIPVGRKAVRVTTPR